MPLSETQRAFVRAYIVDLPSPDLSDPASETPKAKNIKSFLRLWRDAKQSADSGLYALLSEMRKRNHPDFAAIAQTNLSAAIYGDPQKILTALTRLDPAADADGAGAGTLRAEVDAYRQFLRTNAAISVLEQNPLGVSVSIRAPLTAALDRMEDALLLS